jgi:hypothetical protein
MAKTTDRTRSSFNRKRKIQKQPDPSVLTRLEQRVKYRGNPLHKRDPGDFHLTPPAQARDDKTLCEGAGVRAREIAQGLLREGVKRGMISVQIRGQFPQNIWAVTNEGYPLEAQLENQGQGTYHGYPMPTTDPFRDAVISRWSNA